MAPTCGMAPFRSSRARTTGLSPLRIGTLRARRVLLATGLVDVRPVTAGLSEGIAHGAIRFCPICDGYEAMDKRIGVIGPFAHAAPRRSSCAPIRAR